MQWSGGVGSSFDSEAGLEDEEESSSVSHTVQACDVIKVFLKVDAHKMHLAIRQFRACNLFLFSLSPLLSPSLSVVLLLYYASHE